MTHSSDSPPLPPLRVGLVGYGGFGRFLEAAWNALDGVEVAAVADPVQGPDARPTYRDWRDLVARDDLDLVAVATPPATHAEIGVAALEAGRHLLVEKPVALTLADADRLIRARDASDRVAAVDFLLRFNPIVEALTAWARERPFGPLTRLVVENEAQGETMAPEHWFWDPAQSGGLLVEHAVHFLDLAAACSGAPPVRVEGWARRHADGRADRMMALVEHADGLLATHYHAFTRPAAFERTTLRFTFEAAEVECEGWVPMGGRVRTAARRTEVQEQALMRLPGVASVGAPAGSVAPSPSVSAAESEAWACFALPGSKDAAYRVAVQAMVQDVRRAIADPAHAVRAPLEAGREALAVALAASARGLDLAVRAPRLESATNATAAG
jgi:predicted dehydrogenase